MEERPAILARGDGVSIAYHRSAGAGPGVVFLGGFMSDMTGTKAVALETHCRARGRAFLRFDYRGHGQSSGRFEEGTIGLWASDAIAALDALTEGPQVLVGSSMGGWIMLLCARARPQRVAGLVGIAAAPDFTPRMWEELPPEGRAAIERDGTWHRPSQYGPRPYPITRDLFEDGARQLVMDRPLAFPGPIRLLQGMADPDVPWTTAVEMARHIDCPDLAVTLVKGGDHRLSNESDIARLCRTVDEVAAAARE